jgi:hypothetical protein
MLYCTVFVHEEPVAHPRTFSRHFDAQITVDNDIDEEWDRR